VDPFDTGFSIWYLIVDLFQVKGLFRQLFRSKALNRRFRALDGLDLKKTAKQLADDHLLVSFGLIPTVADIQQFVSLLKKWREPYDDMKRKLALPKTWVQQPISLVAQVPNPPSLFGTSNVGIFSLPVSVSIRAEVQTNATWHGMAKYHYNAPEAQGWLARLKQFVDAFGILDPAAIWDVIPWSFVVDWFYGIGHWLHRNRPQLFPAYVVIDDYCESIRLQNRITWYGTYDLVLPDTSSSVQDAGYVYDLVLGSETHTVYLRRRCKPPSLVVSAPQLNTSFLSVRRALISASLLTQRVLR